MSDAHYSHLALLEAERRSTDLEKNKGIRSAIERIVSYVANDANVNLNDRDEILWAQAYRVRFLAAVQKKSGNDAVFSLVAGATQLFERLNIMNTQIDSLISALATANAASAAANAQAGKLIALVVAIDAKLTAALSAGGALSEADMQILSDAISELTQGDEDAKAAADAAIAAVANKP